MVENEHIEQFMAWCLKEHIGVTRNSEVFFVGTQTTIQPTLQLSNNIFVHIIDHDVTDTEKVSYGLFSKSFRAIIVLPQDVIPEFVTHISRADFIKHFKIRI